MRRLVSVDIETTGLDPQRHEIWEVALVPVNPYEDSWCYQLPVTLIGASGEALEIGGFSERYGAPGPNFVIRRWPSGASSPEGLEGALRCIYNQLNGATLLGCSVHFDASFLAELFRKHGFLDPEPWHHRYLDLGSFAGGAWGVKHALSSKAMSDRYTNANAHDALADARWNVEVYRKITAITAGP
jgi:DNA polymerase III epsilon subunit-like protein